MRKFTFLFVMASMLAFWASDAKAQTRNRVVVEVFTGTWCQFCPGAAMGVEDLMHNNKLIVPVKEHIGDVYETTETADRDAASFYNIAGYPTTWFDGKDSIVGGSTNASIYNLYLPLYNNMIAAPTPYDLAGSVSVAGNTATVSFTVTQGGAHTAGDLRVIVAALESHIPDAWLGGLTEVNHTVRDFVPGAFGTAFTVSQGSPYLGSVNFTINPAWVQANMEVAIFIQDNSNKDIYNGLLLPLLPSPNVDPSAISITNVVPTVSCMTSIAPEVIIRNLGTTTLTSVDINYGVNGSTNTYTYTGNLPFYNYATVTLPSINFTPQANNNLTVSVSAAGDGNTSNNSVAKTWAAASQHLVGTYSFSLQLDNYGSETTWEFLDGNGAVIASGGPYTDNNPQLITQNVTIPNEECVTFAIYDAYGDGICCQYGNGSYTVSDPNVNIVVTGGQFSAEEVNQWETKLSIANTPNLSSEVQVYPNPSKGIFTVALGEGFTGNTEVSILTLEGKTVYRTNTSSTNFKADVSELASGMYMLKLSNANGVAIQKITKE